MIIMMANRVNKRATRWQHVHLRDNRNVGSLLLSLYASIRWVNWLLITRQSLVQLSLAALMSSDESSGERDTFNKSYVTHVTYWLTDWKPLCLCQVNLSKNWHRKTAFRILNLLVHHKGEQNENQKAARVHSTWSHYDKKILLSHYIAICDRFLVLFLFKSTLVSTWYGDSNSISKSHLKNSTPLSFYPTRCWVD